MDLEIKVLEEINRNPFIIKINLKIKDRGC
jgi:hypothetical protein